MSKTESSVGSLTLNFHPNFKWGLSMVMLFVIHASIFSQSISGIVRSSDGETIPFASIYIQELTAGTTTNLEGEYSLELPKGISHISFQALGYTKVELKVDMKSNDIVKDITLQPHDYRIKEVRVFSGDEDPAYAIMRKSISMAPYFQRQIKHYKANVYMKGGFDMKKVPRLFRKQMKEEGIEEGKSYVAESINEITFDSPNKYIHKQISKRSTIPNDSEDDIMGFLNYSFYDSDSELAISPVSRKAFSFYKFRYEGFFKQGDFYVNKIKVTPKRKNQKLFEGYIYIVDKLWNIHSVDLVNEQFFGKVRVKQVQEPVKGKAWLPVSHQFDVDVQMMGFKAVANYGGSVKYEKVELDAGLPVPTSLKKAYAEIEEEQAFLEELEKQQQPVLNKSQQKIEELLAKDDLNNREMMKLSRLMEKENKAKEQGDRGLELESRDSLYQIVKDTVSKDSIDWNKIRPIPLSKKEIESFGIKDSLTLAMSGVEVDSVKQEKEKSKFGKGLDTALGGGKKYWNPTEERQIRFKYYGLLDPNNFGFNSVDGFTFSQGFDIKTRYKKRDKLSIWGGLKYAFGREDLMWRMKSDYRLEFINHTKFFFDAGQWSQDFNPNGISPFVNMVSSLFLKENYMKLYKDNYASVGAQRFLANGLMLTIGAKYQHMNRLENSTSYSWGYPNRKYWDNNEINTHPDMGQFDDSKAFSLSAKLEYTPKYYYRIDKGFKRMIKSDYPTFILSYKGGFDGIMESDSRFDMMELRIKQKLEWSYMYNINYDVRGGYYFNNQNMHFSNYTHFNTSQIPISFKDWKNNFNLLNDYEYSTNDWYLEGHFSYSTPYLLIKNIPFLQDKLWNENLYYSHLTQASFKNYNEVGYGITQIFLFANVGVFAGFEDMEFSRWGVRLSLNLGDLD